MALCLDFSSKKRRLAVFGLTSNIFVIKNSDFLALGLLNGDDVKFTLGLLSVTLSGVDSTADSFFKYEKN